MALRDEPEEILQYNYLVKKTEKTKHKWAHIVAGVFVVAIMGLSPAVYFYNKYAGSQKSVENPTAAEAENKRILVEKVGLHVALPVSDSPSIATVSRIETLSSQPFFESAKNGDKVLIYAKVKKAYIYRPSIDRVINIAPIIEPVDENVAEATASAGTELVVKPTVAPTKAPIAVSIYNGTNITGLARKMGVKVKSLVPHAVTKTANAGTINYTNTMVVDIDGTNKAIAKTLAAQLQASVAALPATETKPNASILIIVGAKNVLQ